VAKIKPARKQTTSPDDGSLEWWIESKSSTERVRIAHAVLDEIERPTGGLALTRDELIAAATTIVDRIADRSVSGGAEARKRLHRARFAGQATPPAIALGCAENGSCYVTSANVRATSRLPSFRAAPLREDALDFAQTHRLAWDRRWPRT
jgi:hypothetical protein